MTDFRTTGRTVPLPTPAQPARLAAAATTPQATTPAAAATTTPAPAARDNAAVRPQPREACFSPSGLNFNDQSSNNSSVSSGTNRSDSSNPGSSSNWGLNKLTELATALTLTPGQINDAAFGGRDRAQAFGERMRDQLGGGEGMVNAGRHLHWQAVLAAKHGESVATRIGDAHESFTSNPQDTFIDQHNNVIGREIGLRVRQDPNLTEADIPRLIEEALRNNRAITNPSDPRVPAALQGCVDSSSSSR